MTASLDSLRTAVKGEVHGPEDSGYDEARRIWNAQIDRRPAAVVMCTSTRRGRRARLRPRGRPGGHGARRWHNTGGYAVGDGAVMLNLALMNSVEVDVANRRAKVGGGALLADLDAATQAHGLATPGGMISHTGVAGLTLGGGMGWLIATLNAPPLPFVPEHLHFAPGVLLVLVGFGSPEDHAAQCATVRGALAPAFEFLTPMPYVALQQFQDEATAWGQCNYEKGTQLPDLSDGVIDVLMDALPRRSDPHSMVMFYRLDHAYSTVEELATAYGSTRTPRYATMIVALTPNLDVWAAERDWVRGVWDALTPYSLGIGDYVNNMVEFDSERILASYGPEKYARLAGIKAVYDPENTFRRNVNIPPAG